jgi:hypothetical protein
MVADMKQRFTDDDVRDCLEQAITDAGSLRQFAKLAGVSPTFVSFVRKRGMPPGPRIAAALGFVEDKQRWVRHDENSD